MSKYQKEEFQMRNLKRALSLVMAMAMLVGMMVIGASAASYDDFTDKDKIVNQEAVSTMYALGVINGKEDGSYFDPTANVTRSEMAKMIVVALHGGKDPVLGIKATPTFSDIDNHWAEAYIEYCASNGIISGRGNGKFDPDANVTGTEAAKMLLVALGYNSNVFGFTGESWAINVNTKANDVNAKLYDNLSNLDPSKAITRDQAAQMLYNGTIVAKMLVMTPSETVTSGEVTFNYTYSGTMLNLKFDANIYVGVIKANEYAGLGVAPQKEGQYLYEAFMRDDEPYGTTSGGTFTPGITMIVKGSPSLDMLGKSYKVIIKDSKSAGVYNVVYGDPVLSDMNNIYTVSSDKTTATATSFRNEVRAANISTWELSAATYVNYGGNAVADVTGLSAITNETTLQSSTANGRIINVIDYDNDGAVEYVLVSAPYIGVVSSYDEKGNDGAGYITVARKGSTALGGNDNISGEKFANVVGVKNVAKDDVVSYIQLGDKYVVTKLESVEGTVNAITGDNSKVTVGDTQYTVSSLGKNLDEDNNTVMSSAASVGDGATMYLDAAGYVVYTKATQGTKNYLILTDNAEVLGTVSGVKAIVALADGTKSTISIHSITTAAGTTYAMGDSTNPLVTGNSLNTVTANANAVFAYSVRNDGSYDLTVPKASGDALSGDRSITLNSTINKGNPSIAGSGVIADSNTKFVVKSTTGNWTVYEGIANMPNATSVSGTAIFNNISKVASVVFVHASSIVSDTKSVYILDKNPTATRDSKGNEVYTFKALVDGVYEEIIVSGVSNLSSTIARGAYNGSDITKSGDSYTYSKFTSVGSATEPASDNDVANASYSSAPIFKAVNGNTITGMILGNGTSGTSNAANSSLTVTSNTKIVIITGSNASDIKEGTLADINIDSVNSANNSRGVIVRASYNNTEAGYYQAGVIYIIR